MKDRIPILITLFCVTLVSSTGWYWDTAVQYNTDDNYSTIEGTGWTTAAAILNNDSSVTLAGTFTMYSGALPQFADLADIIATNGTSEELEREITSPGGFKINQTTNDTWTFAGTLINPVLPTEDGHFEVALFSSYNSAIYFFFVNTTSLIDDHYLPSTIANASTTTSTTSTSTTSTSTTSTSTTSTSTTSTTIETEVTGDSNGDGIVSDFELLDYINEWVQGSVSDFNLLAAIDNWAGEG